MKRVVDKHTVAHLWANRSQSDARTASGNFYFENDRIWSYGSHFLIGYHTQNDRGQHAVIITREKNSNTTNGQVNIVLSASNHLTQLRVPVAGMDHEQVFEKWYEEIKVIAGNLQTARKPEKYVSQIRGVFSDAEKYAEFYGLAVPENLIEAGAIQNLDQYSAIVQKEAAFRKVEEEKRYKRDFKIHQAQLKDWRAFKTTYVKTRIGFDYLRFDSKSKRVQTSQRVEIPEAIAKRFYGFVIEAINNGGCTECNMTLMDKYRVEEINKDFIRVGCHKISLKEIKTFVKKQNW
ncbi:hypothetical protein [Mucilaginibacter rubeus]|uniref:hypothetical protein n=1 Tax=Mucilaginibacter rubeus TaxID=2027860 RepID=UPI00166D88F1|nr:hypothetical protein [Mucilaginibacter rubeus]GGA95723.1 hypothetical protein GCM10011500_09380 [Mucilaginibacter rubeus]